MRKNIKYAFFGLLLSAVMLASGCGEKEEKPYYVTLNVATILGDAAEYGVYSGLLDEFTAENELIRVRDTSSPRENGYKLGLNLESTYGKSGSPDVIYTTWAEIRDSNLAGQFVSLEEIRRSDPEFAANIYPAALDTLRDDESDIYCVPVMGEWGGILVNTALLDEAGARPPNIWKDLLDTVDSLTARGTLPFANPPEEGAIAVEQMQISTGINIIESAETGPRIDGAVMGAYAELRRRNAFPRAAAADPDGKKADGFALFNEGKAAMIFIDQDTAGRINTSSDAFESGDITLIPAPNPVSVFQLAQAAPGGCREGFFITRRAYDSANLRPAALAFVSAMTSPGAGERFAAIGALPVAEGCEISDDDGDSASVRIVSLVYGNLGKFSRLALSIRTSAHRAFWDDVNKTCLGE